MPFGTEARSNSVLDRHSKVKMNEHVKKFEQKKLLLHHEVGFGRSVSTLKARNE